MAEKCSFGARDLELLFALRTCLGSWQLRDHPLEFRTDFHRVEVHKQVCYGTEDMKNKMGHGLSKLYEGLYRNTGTKLAYVIATVLLTRSWRKTGQQGQWYPSLLSLSSCMVWSCSMGLFPQVAACLAVRSLQ